MQKEELTVVVTSCDSFSDLHIPFSELFKKFWRDCPFDVVLATQSEIENKNETVFSTVYAWGDVPWTERFKQTLFHIETPYIMLILDDYFLTDTVKNIDIKHFLAIIKQHNAGGFRLEKTTKHIKPITNEYGECVRGEVYRINAHIGIWDKSYLIRLLNDLGPCEAWNFERNGSSLSDKYPEPLLGSLLYNFKYIEMVRRSCWLRAGVTFCAQQNVELKLSKRKIQPVRDIIQRKLQGLVYCINPAFFTKVAALFKK